MKFTVTQIAGMLGGEVSGDGNQSIVMLAKIQDAKKGQIAFLSNPKYEHFIYTTNACLQGLPYYYGSPQSLIPNNLYSYQTIGHIDFSGTK